MRILSFLILFVIIFFSRHQPDSPHGSDLKISCNQCHSTKGWQLDREIYSFNHNTTKLPLVGQHKETNCRQCHQSLVFKEAKNECNECHKDIHQGTAGFECSRCHTPSSWLVSNINEIHQLSRFPLVGAHRTADCYQCHKSENNVRFDVPGIECIDCHRADYLATTNPKHPEAGFSQDCSTCHILNSNQWSGAGFNHNFFPLIQGHSAPKCDDCHTTGRYADASPDCYSCHQKDYLAALNPNHNTSKFPTSCGDCHTLNPGWKPANFDHNLFPLTLGHSTPTCNDCHKGNFISTPSDCFACHQENYNATTNPGHQSLGFSTACMECHTTNPGWKPASYLQHDSKSFPIYSGKHKGEWSSCTDCHTNVSNYSQFSCITCHEHNKTEMDSKHKEETGYSYDSASCLRCHPRGTSN